MITLEICQKQPFDIIAMTPRGTLGLCCVHIAQLMTHPVDYTLPFTLQLCYKPLGTLQRVTKSQKVHISSHDVLQKSHTCEEGEAHLRFSFWHLLMNYEKAKNSGFWKNDKKKKLLEIIILHMCTKNHNQIPFWDMEWHKSFLSYRAISCPLPTPPPPP